MADRKAELERKKAKLEQLRAEKKLKEEEKKKVLPGGTPPVSSGSVSNLRSEADEILKELGISPADGLDKPIKQEPVDAGVGGGAVTSLAESKDAVFSGKRPVAALAVSKLTQTNIPPRELVQYCKETQTTPSADNDDSIRSSAPDDVDDEVVTPQPVNVVEPDQTNKAAEQVEKPPPRVLTEDECKQIVSSDDFMRFFDRASRIVERAIAEDIDIFTDYLGDATQSSPDRGEHLREVRQFFDEKWSRHRTVTSLDWSTEFPELLVAGYDGNQESPHEPDGVALVWNLKYKKTSPEYMFQCQSSVLSACFAPFHPNLVIGGTYSGQVVLWDTRTNRRTPAQRTPLSNVGHTHPVYCVGVIGTANAHNLASISTDGKMCFWSLDMLATPQETLELQYRQAKSVAAICYSFFAGDPNSFVIGAEDGIAYSGARHGARAGVSGDIFEGHCGPVTGIDCHSVGGPLELSTYFLTSSFDWTVKLWNLRDSRPLLSLEDNSDYVYDVRWSPVHPAVFASVDGTGRLDVWNLNGDTEVPAASVVFEGSPAVNKCRWNAAGATIAAGDATGRLHICELDSSLALPHQDEWTRLVRTISDLKADRADVEEFDPTSSAAGVGSIGGTVTQSPMRSV